MKRLFACFLVLALAFTANAQQTTKGYVTIGTGAGSGPSSGMYNLDAFDDFGKCLKTASHFGREVHFLAGTYDIDAPFVDGTSNLLITAEPGAVFNIANTAAVGAFDLSGGYVTIDGLHFTVGTFTNSQIVIRLTGTFQTVRNCDFLVSTASGNTSTPMTMVQASGALDPTIDKNSFLPNKGVRCVYLLEGHGGWITYNLFRNTSTSGIAGTGEPPSASVSSRKCFEVVRIEGGQWFQVTDNWVWGLGDSTDPVSKIFYYNRLGTPTSSEEGHFTISRNRVEEVYATKAAIQVQGGRWFNIDNNRIGWLRDSLEDVGEAAIYVSATESSPGTEDGADIATSGSISGNELHNTCKSHNPPIGGGNDSLSSAIYIGYAKNLNISDNVCTLMYSYASIVFDGQKCDQISCTNNLIHSNDITQEYGFAIIGGSGARIYFHDNQVFDVSTADVLSLSTASIYSGVRGYSKTTSLTFTASGATIAGSAAELQAFPINSWIWTEGASNAGNNGFHRITATNGTTLTVTPANLVNETVSCTIISLNSNSFNP